MLEGVESQNSPAVRNLVAWVKFHQEKGMMIDMDTESAKEFRIICHKCYGIGHKGSDCQYTTDKPLLCIICGGRHHPRDCYRGKRGKSAPQPIEDTPDTVETSTPAGTAKATTTDRAGRNDREKNARKANIDIQEEVPQPWTAYTRLTGATKGPGEPIQAQRSLLMPIPLTIQLTRPKPSR